MSLRKDREQQERQLQDYILEQKEVIQAGALQKRGKA